MATMLYHIQQCLNELVVLKMKNSILKIILDVVDQLLQQTKKLLIMLKV